MQVEVQERGDGEADLGLPVGVDVVALDLHGRPVAPSTIAATSEAEQLSSWECTTIDRFPRASR